MTRILVTGASGFVGRQVIDLLAESGHEVHSIENRTRCASGGSTQWHRANLLTPGVWPSLIEKIRPTHILHLAWYAEPGKFWTSPENLHWVRASLEMFEAAASNGVRRVVVCGSCAEYDWSHGRCAESSTPLVPATYYGNAKRALHLLADSYLVNQDMSLAWGRVFFLYGPGEDRRRLVASVIRSLLQGNRAPVSHGNQMRDFIHVRDVADALVTLLQSDIRGAINIASGTPVKIATVVETIARQLGRENSIEWGAVPVSVNEPESLTADVTRLRQELHWQPVFDLDGGISDTIAWWENQLQQSLS